jgi:hypothetical protein
MRLCLVSISMLRKEDGRERAGEVVGERRVDRIGVEVELVHLPRIGVGHHAIMAGAA